MRLHINKTKFISGFKQSFVKLNTKSEAGLFFLIDKLNQEDRLKNIPQYAYFLSTVFHESTWKGSYFVPIKEGKASSGTTTWIKYQSKYWNTGFYGRGYVQTTHETNYRNAGILLGLGSEFFIDDPDQMLKAEYSYESAIISMQRGLYRKNKRTGKRESLDVYLSNENNPDYVNARNIINGDVKKNGALIASYAVKFERLIHQAWDTETALKVENGEDITVNNEPVRNDLPMQSADVIVNNQSADPAPEDKVPDDFVEEEKDVDAPPPQGTGKKSFTLSAILAGIAYYTGIPKEFIPWIFCLIVLLIILYFVKEFLSDREKQKSLRLAMELNADPNKHDIKVNRVKAEPSALDKLIDLAKTALSK